MYYLLGSGKPQWTTFRHNGPMFPPKYEPHNIPVFVNNVKIVLPPESEEYELYMQDILIQNIQQIQYLTKISLMILKKYYQIS